MEQDEFLKRLAGLPRMTVAVHPALLLTLLVSPQTVEPVKLENWPVFFRSELDHLAGEIHKNLTLAGQDLLFQ